MLPLCGILLYLFCAFDLTTIIIGITDRKPRYIICDILIAAFGLFLMFQQNPRVKEKDKL